MNINEATIEFVREHRNEDVRALALQARRDGEVDLPWALDQIGGWQTARRKLPTWATTDGLIYPPHLSMEQCSSEQTARYKTAIAARLPMPRKTLIDFTGGFGVDFAFMATAFEHATYVERQEHLCATARHNFDLLGLSHTSVVNDDAEDVLKNGIDAEPASTLLYLDPARRDSNAARTYAITDCMPNVLELQGLLLKAAHHVLIKLSPMLDWHKAMADLGKCVSEVHIVSVANECKELLVLLDTHHNGMPTIHCVNDEQTLIYTPNEQQETQREEPPIAHFSHLYEPNASIMKAGCFDVLATRYRVQQLATDSHLFVSDTAVDNFPGRRFKITATTSLNKKELNRALHGIDRANVAVRNFPMTAQELRKRLKLQDGGDCYIFGTTTTDKQRILFICEKM